MEDAKFTGAFGSVDSDFKVAFLEKQANADRTKLQLERLRKDAFTSANRVDFRDDKTNAQSGYARVLELQTLEDDCTLKRIEMQRVASNMYEIASGGYARVSTKLEWESVKTEYSSNLPVDLTYYADFIQKTFGKMPLVDIYNQVPFIPNAKESAEQFTREVQGVVDLTSSVGGT